MWIYDALIIFLLLSAIPIFGIPSSNSSVGKKVYLAIAFIPLFILSAFRSSNVGSDTNTYLLLFERVKYFESLEDNMTRYETGYLLFNKFIAYFTDNSQILLIITSVIVLIPIFIFIYRYSENVWLSIYLFITFRFYYFTMSGLRQSIAIALILYSLKYVRRRQFYPFLLIVTLAACFHSSAIIFLVAYPLAYVKFTYKKAMLILSSTVFACLAFNYIVSFILTLFPQYQHYVDSKYFQMEGKYAIILMSVMAACIMLFGFATRYHEKVNIINSIYKTVEEYNEAHFYSYMILVSFVLSLFALQANIIDRAQLYFAFFYIVFIPNALSTIQNKSLKLIFMLILLVATFINHNAILWYRPSWNSVYPYDFFWN